MEVNNEIYNELADSWWDKKGMLHLLSVLNVARFSYLKDIIINKHGTNLAGKRILDIGCGGGLLAEEFAALGCEVTGIDPSAPSIATAKAHALQSGLQINYMVGAGESLPFDNESFDIVYCCDALEHMNDWRQAITEAVRVLKTEGLFLYDTLNRTIPSALLTKLLQDWTSIMPKNTHVWKMFIKPSDLRTFMSDRGLANQETVGLGPSANIIRQGKEFIKVIAGKQTFAEGFSKMSPAATRNQSVMYMGYAIKAAIQ